MKNLINPLKITVREYLSALNDYSVESAIHDLKQGKSIKGTFDVTEHIMTLLGQNTVESHKSVNAFIEQTAMKILGVEEGTPIEIMQDDVDPWPTMSNVLIPKDNFQHPRFHLN